MRWIVDTDGRGECRVADDAGGSSRFVTEPMTRQRCERAIERLRKGDAERLHRSRVENGRRLAAGRWQSHD